MASSSVPIEGSCRCGAVRLRITAPPLLTMVCHCTGCQKMTASAFSISTAIPTDGFAVEGDTVIGGIHGADAHHHHCDRCKSWLFTRIDPDMGFVNVRATMLDDARDFVPFVETYTSEALPWVTTPAPHKFATVPSMDQYGPIVARFAAARGAAAV